MDDAELLGLDAAGYAALLEGVTAEAVQEINGSPEFWAIDFRSQTYRPVEGYDFAGDFRPETEEVAVDLVPVDWRDGF